MSDGTNDQGFFERLRGVVGNAPVEGRKKGIAGFRPAPGPFDSPPEEPVVLDGDLPWELRDEPDTTRS
jgi:hypothetical protein